MVVLCSAEWDKCPPHRCAADSPCFLGLMQMLRVEVLQRGAHYLPAMHCAHAAATAAEIHLMSRCAVQVTSLRAIRRAQWWMRCTL